jgi:hypothetical protein
LRADEEKSGLGQESLGYIKEKGEEPLRFGKRNR